MGLVKTPGLLSLTQSHPQSGARGWDLESTGETEAQSQREAGVWPHLSPGVTARTRPGSLPVRTGASRALPGRSGSLGMSRLLSHFSHSLACHRRGSTPMALCSGWCFLRPFVVQLSCPSGFHTPHFGTHWAIPTFITAAARAPGRAGGLAQQRERGPRGSFWASHPWRVPASPLGLQLSPSPCLSVPTCTMRPLTLHAVGSCFPGVLEGTGSRNGLLSPGAAHTTSEPAEPQSFSLQPLGHSCPGPGLDGEALERVGEHAPTLLREAAPSTGSWANRQKAPQRASLGRLL